MVVVAAESDDRPAVVRARFDEVDLISTVGPVFRVENGAGRMNDQAQMIAVAERINLRAIALLARVPRFPATHPFAASLRMASLAPALGAHAGRVK